MASLGRRVLVNSELCLAKLSAGGMSPADNIPSRDDALVWPSVDVPRGLLESKDIIGGRCDAIL